MASLVSTLLLMCLIPLTRAHELRRGLELADDATTARPGGVTVPVHFSQAFYVVNLTIGTPPQPVSAIIDIGGELVWTQCAQHCRRCFKQDLPLFDTNASSTFRPEPCGAAVCESIPTRSCAGDGGGACGGGAPDLVLAFQGGAEMTVPVSSYLFDAGNDTACVAILGSPALGGVSILGSLQQVNIHLLFDLDKETLSFEPADCSALS
ncbi:hypothetical protein OsJ_32299 [Oryza sativa Japonica Group]|uniref:Peptidase A1 domain-containing protein n=1 Tax=Oryza sativa subsp. japonica TaxID=39947 RepID=A3C6W4_ORYSJ|nr:hypothetical protein OsJ_32299 [Oryza sativa Japonica Group]